MNIKPPVLIIHPNGLIYISSIVREYLGPTFKWEVVDGKVILRSGRGTMFYDCGTCCCVPLVKALGIKKKTVIQLVDDHFGDGHWEGMICQPA